MTYEAPVADIAFALRHAAGFDAALAAGLYGDLSDDIVDAVLDEAGRFATEVLAPLNTVGDRHGALFKDGAVTMPPGWKEAYGAWAAAGWNALAAPADWGGQELPKLCTKGLNVQALPEDYAGAVGVFVSNHAATFRDGRIMLLSER